MFLARQPSSPEPTSEQPNRATGPHGTFTLGPNAQNTQKPTAPGSSSGPGDRVGVTSRPHVGEDKKPDSPGTVGATPPQLPGRQPSSPEPVPEQPSRATGPHGSFTLSPNAQPTVPGSSSGPGDRVNTTPGPHVGENEKPDFSGAVHATPPPDVPGRQPSSPEPTPEQPNRATGPHGTFTPSPDSQNTQKPRVPGTQPGPDERITVTPRPHVGENEKPDSPGTVDATPPPNPFTPGFPSRPDSRANVTTKPRPNIETDRPGSRSSSTTSQPHNPEQSQVSSEPTNRVAGPFEHTTRSIQETRKPATPGFPSRPDEGVTHTREPASTDKPKTPKPTHELSERVSVTPRPSVPERLPSSAEPSSTSSSTSESPSEVTITRGRVASTPRPDNRGTHRQTPESPNGTNERASTTSRPDVPNSRRPATFTSSTVSQTRTTEPSEGFKVNRTQTTGPMIEIDGEMNPQQPDPDSVTPSNRKGLSTSSPTSVVEERVPPATKEQDRQNFTTTLPEILSTTPATLSSNGATVVNEKTSSTFEVGPTNTTISFLTSPTASPPPSFTLHTTVPVVSSTAPSRPVTDAPTSTTAPSKPDFIEPDILIDSELHSTTEDDLKVVVESFETTLPPPNEGQVTNKRCSSTDRSMCHELAICEVATGSCRCKDGFTGDGYSNCT
ncbi:hypothetical protein OSTOST_11187 [Ostertagia ostertagi]